MSSRTALLGAVAFAALLAHAAGAADAGSGGAAAPASDRLAERAHQLFDEGVRLANEQRFDSARAVFRSAYELQPHPSVLYNIAQCEVHLGDLTSAAATLEQFLQSSGSEIPEPQRQAVQRQLEELRAGLPAQPSESAGSPSAAALHDSTSSSPESSGNTADGAGDILDVPAAGSASAAPSGAGSSLRPLVLGGTGVALLGVAAALYVWNDDRHDAWSSEHAELASVPGFRAQLARDLELWRRADASNQRLSSIHTVDVVSLILATAGAIALGGGAWDWLTSEGESAAAEAAASRGPGDVSRLRLLASRGPLLYWQTRW